MLTNYGISYSAVINIVFVGRNKMKAIAAKYRHEKEALPVLSFSYLDLSLTPGVGEADVRSAGKTPGVEKLIGEIFICYPQAIILAAEKEKKVDNIIIFLIKHGVDNILK